MPSSAESGRSCAPTIATCAAASARMACALVSFVRLRRLDAAPHLRHERLGAACAAAAPRRGTRAPVRAALAAGLLAEPPGNRDATLEVTKTRRLRRVLALRDHEALLELANDARSAPPPPAAAAAARGHARPRPPRIRGVPRPGPGRAGTHGVVGGVPGARIAGANAWTGGGPRGARRMGCVGAASEPRRGVRVAVPLRRGPTRPSGGGAGTAAAGARARARNLARRSLRRRAHVRRSWRGARSGMGRFAGEGRSA